MKESILQEDITILNVYAPHNRGSSYVKPKMMELQEVDEFTVITVDFNTPLSKWTCATGIKSVRT